MKKIIEFVKFSFVGGIMTILNLVLFTLMVEFLKINYLVSNVLSYIIAITLSYFLNYIFTFKMQNISRKEHIKRIINYFIMKLSLLALDSICLYLLVDIFNLNVYLSKIGLTITFLIISYPLSKLIIGKRANNEELS